MSRHRPDVTRIDAVLACVVGLAVCAAVWFGAGAATEDGVGSADGTADFQRALEVHAGVDPLKPPGLPAGASIDPKTGRIAGVDVHAAAGEKAITWALLAGGNAVADPDSVPAALRALDGKVVVLVGFQMALYEVRAMSTFMLVGSHYTCCFGRPPGFGDQLTVHLRDGAPRTDATARPVRVRGTFRVRPQHLHEGGRGPLIALFEIVEADAIVYDG